MMKKLTLVCFSVLLYIQAVKAQKSVAPPWPGVNYASAKVFLYNLDNQLYGQYQAWKDGVPNFTLVGEGTNLNGEQLKQLETVLNGDTRALNDGLAKCYEPHHAVFFYDAAGKVVAAFDVCFLCEGIRFYPAKQYKSELKMHSDAQTKAAYKQLEQIKAVFTSAGVPVFKNEAEVNVYRDEMVKNDTLTVISDSVFSLLKESYGTLNELKKELGDLAYKLDSNSYMPNKRETTVPEFNEMTEYFNFFGPVIQLNCTRKMTYGLYYIDNFRTQAKTGLLPASLNIGQTRSKVNDLFINHRKGYAHHRTICFMSKDRKKSLIVHFGDKTIDQVTYSTLPSNHARPWANRKK